MGPTRGRSADFWTTSASTTVRSARPMPAGCMRSADRPRDAITLSHVFRNVKRLMNTGVLAGPFGHHSVIPKAVVGFQELGVGFCFPPKFSERSQGQDGEH